MVILFQTGGDNASRDIYSDNKVCRYHEDTGNMDILLRQHTAITFQAPEKAKYQRRRELIMR